MVDVTGISVRYFAAAADAAGCTKETLDLPVDADLGQVKEHLLAKYGPEMQQVLSVSAFLVDSELTRDLTRTAGTQVDVLPPFAGG
ncbi:MoaD/ThiS family protein [Rhodococcus opacus]|uniref:Molybdopterin synthase sulfur carrier subunit n=1 Tax=Rhodococcus opacus TaxID=37919 RepID=A0A2S8JH15_RHOOP|nr:MoaD/ThiS family protein [Rhodococcus opacus]PQP26336.1 molybdopterin synthase sulfur carrier subunit [Rhodococcus opacus]